MLDRKAQLPVNIHMDHKRGACERDQKIQYALFFDFVEKKNWRVGVLLEINQLKARIHT